MADSVLVTGGAGFIGSHLVRALLARGDRVRVLDNFATGDRGNLTDLRGDIDLVEGDLRSPEACKQAVRGIARVLHQGAIPSVPRSVADPLTTNEVNVTGTLNLLTAARDAGVQRLVFASSSSLYGPIPKMPREETDRLNPISPYAVSKVAGEAYCLAFFHAYRLETVALRYFNVFGPRQKWDSPYAAVLPKFIRSLRRKEPAAIFGDGEQARDFTYIDNVVDANLKALSAPRAPGSVYNIATGNRTSVKELLVMTAKVLGVEPQFTLHPTRAGDVRDSQADISRARADLGYEAAISMEEGLRRTVAWSLAQGD